MLAACAADAPQTVLFGEPDKRARIVAEMKEVIPHVTSEQFKQCTVKLEQPGWRGERYKVSGPYNPSVRYSCVHRSVNFFKKAKDFQIATYAVFLEKVAGPFGSGNSTYAGFCVIAKSAKDGSVHVRQTGREVRVQGHSSCTYMSEGL